RASAVIEIAVNTVATRLIWGSHRFLPSDDKTSTPSSICKYYEQTNPNFVGRQSKVTLGRPQTPLDGIQIGILVRYLDQLDRPSCKISLPRPLRDSNPSASWSSACCVIDRCPAPKSPAAP